MDRIRNIFFAGAAFALISSASLPAFAGALQVAQIGGPCHVSLFGTIARVIAPNEFTLQTNSRYGSIHVYDNGARFAANGLTPRVGERAGVFGCFSAGERSFKASQVTLRNEAGAEGSLGPCHVSLFGTVTQVFGNRVELAVQTTGPLGNVHIYDKGALFHTNGQSLAPGVFGGFYGCFVNGRRFFHAEEVTLASSAQTYAAYAHPTVSTMGTIDEVRRGFIGMTTPYYGHMHVYTNQSGFRIGERVFVRGTFNTGTRSLTATSISIR